MDEEILRTLFLEYWSRSSKNQHDKLDVLDYVIPTRSNERFILEIKKYELAEHAKALNIYKSFLHLHIDDKAHLENDEHLAQSEAPPRSIELPWLAERAACLLVPRSDGDGTLGDLEEKYRKYVVRHGPRFALVWYWWQVGSLFGPRLRSLLLWIGGLAGLRKALDWIGKLGGS